MTEIQQKFEALLDDYAARARGRILADLECNATAEFEARWAVLLSWRAAYEAGESAMREKAAGLAKSCAEILSPEQRVAATWIGDKIRQLSLSGAEESKKEDTNNDATAATTEDRNS